MGIPRCGRREHRLRGGVVHVAVADLRDRSRVAAPHAGSPDHPHPARAFRLEGGHELDGPRELTGEAVAYPDGERRRRVGAVRDDVEVGVERRDLVHLRLGEAVLGRKGREMPGVERPEAVLDEMEVLDEVVAAVRADAEELADVVARRGIDLPALGRRPPAPPPAPVRRDRAARIGRIGRIGRAGTGRGYAARHRPAAGRTFDFGSRPAGGRAGGRGPGRRSRPRPRRAIPRHQERTRDRAPRPGGEGWLGGAVILRGRSENVIVLPPGWRLWGRRRRLRATFDQDRFRDLPRAPVGRRQTYRSAHLDATLGAGPRSGRASAATVP